MVHTWHILQYLAYTAIPGIYRNTWHIPQYLAYTAIPGIYRNTWHISQYLAYTAIPGIYRNTWHISQYLDSLLYRTQRGRTPQISFTAEIYRFHLQQISRTGFYRFHLVARFYRFHLRQKFTNFICREIYRFHLQQDFTDFICGGISNSRTEEFLPCTEHTKNYG